MKIGKPLLIVFLVGCIIQIYIGGSDRYSAFIGKFVTVTGGATGFLIAVVALPLIVAIILFFKNKTFPYQTFSTMTYIILGILTLIMIVGYNNLKAMSLWEQDKLEVLRNQYKSECIKVTVDYFDLIESDGKKELKENSKKYCECLSGRISGTDLQRVADGKILMPELLNIEYKKQQDDCFQETFKNFKPENISTQFTKDNEKKAFWTGRLISYYLMTYGEFKSEYIAKLSTCFNPIFEHNFEIKIADWEKRDLTATEIFRENPCIKDKIEECYKNVR